VKHLPKLQKFAQSGHPDNDDSYGNELQKLQKFFLQLPRVFYRHGVLKQGCQMLLFITKNLNLGKLKMAFVI
jgi:hypothetical protein